jgi:hypothetical protein
MRQSAKQVQTSGEVIRASELGQYLYCAQAWWLGRVEGVQPSNVRQLESGSAAHTQHGVQVALAGLLARVALVCLALGGLLALIYLVLAML